MKITIVAFLLLALAVPTFAKDHKATFPKTCKALSSKWLADQDWHGMYISQPDPKNYDVLIVSGSHAAMSGRVSARLPIFSRVTARGVLHLSLKGKDACTVTNHGGQAKVYLERRVKQWNKKHAAKIKVK